MDYAASFVYLFSRIHRHFRTPADLLHLRASCAPLNRSIIYPNSCPLNNYKYAHPPHNLSFTLYHCRQKPQPGRHLQYESSRHRLRLSRLLLQCSLIMCHRISCQICRCCQSEKLQVAREWGAVATIATTSRQVPRSRFHLPGQVIIR